MNKIANFDGRKIKNILAGSLVLGTLSLTGCGETELAPDIESTYDTLSTDQYGVLDAEDGCKQVLDVPGEDFKLVVEYSVDLENNSEWIITAPKKLFTKVYTEGLEGDKKVYIDNVHTDVSTISNYTVMNGILQDTMDDRIHNSVMYGFPISDTVNYYATNQIEGQNDTFISGSFYGFKNYSGSITEKRFEEHDYLERGVYGSLISSSYGLLIQNGDDVPYGVDVDSTIIAYANNEVQMYVEDKDGDEIVTYRYDRDGEKEEVSREKVKSK